MSATTNAPERPQSPTDEIRDELLDDARQITPLAEPEDDESRWVTFADRYRALEPKTGPRYRGARSLEGIEAFNDKTFTPWLKRQRQAIERLDVDFEGQLTASTNAAVASMARARAWRAIEYAAHNTPIPDWMKKQDGPRNYYYARIYDLTRDTLDQARRYAAEASPFAAERGGYDGRITEDWKRLCRSDCHLLARLYPPVVPDAEPSPAAKRLFLGMFFHDRRSLLLAALAFETEPRTELARSQQAVALALAADPDTSWWWRQLEGVAIPDETVLLLDSVQLRDTEVGTLHRYLTLTLSTLKDQPLAPWKSRAAKQLGPLEEAMKSTIYGRCLVSPIWGIRSPQSLGRCQRWPYLVPCSLEKAHEGCTLVGRSSQK